MKRQLHHSPLSLLSPLLSAVLFFHVYRISAVLYFSQRPDKTMVDVEGGQGQLIRRDGEEEEEDKKGEAGYHPIVAQLWSVVRSVCPSALQCIGEQLTSRYFNLL